MTTNYPAALDTFTTKVDGVDDVLAEHVNSLQTDVIAIETELGTLPKGAAADVKTRLNGIDATIAALVSIPPHYRDGCLVEFADAGNIRVSQGVLEINGDQYEMTSDSGLIALATAGNWVNGSEGANMWVYIYATPNGAGLTIKLSDEAPLYPKCDTGSLAFYGQIAGEPAANATAIVYDNETGEANIRAGDIVRCWTDSDYGTVRGGWRVVSVNTGTNTFTMEANNVDAADNDYLTIVKGLPRYRQYAGVWYRCLGAVRNNAGSNIIKFTSGDRMVNYDDISVNLALTAGHATAYAAVSLAAFIPPYANKSIIFPYITGAAALRYINVRETGSAATWAAYAEGDAGRAIMMNTPAVCSPNQAVDYAVDNAATSGYIYVGGWFDPL